MKFLPDDKFKIQSILLLAICVCVLGGILVAGLWPFHAPKNEVSWLPEGNGVLFGKHGSIVSADLIKASGLRAEKSCSLEIWLQPKRLTLPDHSLFLFTDQRNRVFFIRAMAGRLSVRRS